MSSEQLQALRNELFSVNCGNEAIAIKALKTRNELFSVNCGNEAIAIKALKTDLIKIIVSLT